ncbi:MAG: hypothetical protein HY049_08945 [Acidobacteria bacterium]|nr:hypothetical protein [Acidobacteriota bacterium]
MKCPKTRLLALAAAILLGGGAAFAENIDPGNAGSKFAWSENLGWINARPGGAGGPGVQVSDSGLTGWAWSENAGWISLSCANRSCAAGSYGVTNDGCGTLAGYAWSENAGWINFAPAGAGVTIDPVNGNFSGRAWSENAGWITFSSSSPVAYRVTTGWRRAAPLGAPGVTATSAAGGAASFSWAALPGATSYDIVQGRLSALRSAHGNFQAATQACVAHTTGTSVTLSGTPALGDGTWYLVRGASCGGAGTYNDGSQVGSRDAGINASGNGCP